MASLEAIEGALSQVQFVAVMTLTLASLGAAGFVVRAALARMSLPPAVSLMALGLVLGPAVADWLPETWLEHRNTLSKAAFVVLLLRAGLALPRTRMRSVAVAALWFGTVPVVAELLAVVGLAQVFGLFDRFSLAVLAAFVTAAVSPAVILPAMLNQKDLGRGVERCVPDRIVGQTVVNAFIAQTGILLVLRAMAPDAVDDSVGRALLWLPLQLIGGIALGLAAAAPLGMGWLLRTPHDLETTGQSAAPSSLRLSLATLAIIAVGLALYFGCQRLALESVFATLAVGFALKRRIDSFEPHVRRSLRNVWQVAEIVLFANLGSQIEIHRIHDPRQVALLVVIVAAALAVRLIVTALMVKRTDLTPGERSYTTVSHIPKATIQAVFGALPLATFVQRGQSDLVADGHTILILAVVAILCTAPVGAVLLERWAARDLGAREPNQSPVSAV